jgi:hypothetical protein
VRLGVNKVAIIFISFILAVVAGLAGYTCTATAQSVNEEVGLEAHLLPAIEFTVDPDSIDFDAGGLHTVTITNTGAWDLSVSCSATGPHAEGLKINGEPWGLFNTTIERDGCQEIDVVLTIPENYTGVEESEAIIFWAAEAR